MTQLYDYEGFRGLTTVFSFLFLSFFFFAASVDEGGHLGLLGPVCA